jgi:VWFA-related protein
MIRTQVYFAVASIVVIFTALLNAQTVQTNETKFTSSTELVLIPTVVNDKSGIPISGLQKEQFALKQDGKPRSIAVFEEVKTTSDRLHRSEGEHGTFSNYETDGNEYHRLNTILLDFVNTPFADQIHAKNELVRFLTEAAESGDPMCLLALNRSGLTVLHNFTENPKLLAEALRKVESDTGAIHDSIVDPGHPKPSDPLGAAIMAMIRRQLESEAQVTSMERQEAASITARALLQIAIGLRGLPGRKALIWASSGFPFSLTPPDMLTCDPACPVRDSDEMHSEYAKLWRTMNDAQIAIYTVDLRSASSSMPTAEEGTFTHPSDIGDPQFDTAAQAQWKRQDTDSTLKLFAENTGGKAFLGGNNLLQSFRKATADDSNYYMLGYYVSRSSAKPGWHQISVTINRKGAHARYRSGFFLSSDTSASSAQSDVRLALGSPLDFVGVPVSVTWSGRDAGKFVGNTRMRFDLVMPPNFAFVDESDQNHMIVDIAAAARNGNGEVVVELSQRIDTHLKPDGLEQIQRNGMTYRNSLQLPPGEYTVRFVVRDSLGNRMGSVAAPIKVAQ